MAQLSYFLIIVIALTCVLAEESYSDQYDEVDVMNILQNDILREEYYKCFLGTELCKTADAKFFKKIFSEALQTKCKKCTEKQKQNMNQVADWFVKNKPEQWQALVAKSVEDMKKASDQ